MAKWKRETVRKLLRATKKKGEPGSFVTAFRPHVFEISELELGNAADLFSRIASVIVSDLRFLREAIELIDLCSTQSEYKQQIEILRVKHGK